MQRADAFDATATQHNTAVSPPNHYDQGRGSGSADGKLADGLLAQLSQDVGRLGDRIAAGAQPQSYAASLDQWSAPHTRARCGRVDRPMTRPFARHSPDAVRLYQNTLTSPYKNPI